VSALWHVVRHPLATWHLAVSPHEKVTLLRWLFAPLGFASLASPFVLLALPLLAERLLSQNPNHWTLTHQYSAPFVPILTLAAVDGVGRLRRLTEGLRRGHTSARHRGIAPRVHAVGPVVYSLGVLAVAVWACGRMPFNELTKASMWRTSAYTKVQQAAVDVVPSGVSVEASNWLAPHLVDRADVMLLDATPHNAPWVVFDEGNIEFPMTPAAQSARVEWLSSHGYSAVFSQSGIVVYHRTSAPPTTP
jgi:uncharacterized membrane protein